MKNTSPLSSIYIKFHGQIQTEIISAIKRKDTLEGIPIRECQLNESDLHKNISAPLKIKQKTRSEEWRLWNVRRSIAFT
jgi:hypothetical protein